jgi:CRP/FNR family transcriptional regulator, nitrogen oxide reductase regulator
VHILAPSTPPKLLSGLTPPQQEVVIQSAERRKIPAKGVIVRAGEPAANLFVLTEGTVKYYRVTKTGEEVLLWWLTTDDSFGLGSLLAGPLNYIATAQAVEDSELLVWSAEKIRALAASYKLIAQNALHIVLYALGTYTDRVVGLATGTAEQRLARTLLQFGRQLGQVRHNGVELTIFNEHLARMANVSTFTASRQLKDWERRGIIRKSRGKVLILSPEALLID